MQVTAMLTCTSNQKRTPPDGEAVPADETAAYITLEAKYRPVEERGPEEALYGKHTPAASFGMNVIGSVADNFVVGQVYKVTFEPME